MRKHPPTPFEAVLAGIALALLLAASPGRVEAGDPERSQIKGSFENTGLNPGASGRFTAKFKSTKAKITIKLRGLDPNASHQLIVGGIPEATFTPNSRGRAKLRFEVPLKSSRATLLAFDPRGETVAVHDGVGDVLRLVAAGPGEPTGLQVKERTLLLAEDPNCPGQEAQLRFRQKRDGRQRFRVKIEGVEPGDYALFVGGIQRATISVEPGDDDGKVEFRTPLDPRRPLLDFEPRGEDIAITRGAQMCFSGPLEAQTNGVNVCDEGEDEVCLGATPEAGEGEARAALETDDDCEQELEIKVRAVPEGDLAVCVGGILRGNVEVDTHEDDPNDPEDPNDPRIESTTHIRFFKPFHEGKLLLDFEPDLSDIEVRLADPNAEVGEACPATTLLFSGVDPNCPVQEDPCAEEDVDVTLLNQADPNAPDATGRARCDVDGDCDQEFRVRVEDLPVGDYDLVVDGVVQATVTVSGDPNDPGETEGRVRFATAPDEPEESTFPEGFPSVCGGLEIAIRQGSTDFLLGTLPTD